MKEALFYEPLGGNRVHCLLCPQDCVIAPGRTGFCRVRVNRGGTLFSLNYDRVMAAGMDPVEKKPLYHFHPGAAIFSIGTIGCNQHCDFCQNWQMLEPDAPASEMSAETAVREAKERGSTGIAYTYNEPGVWYEFVIECCRLVRNEGMKNVLVTNGSINPEPFLRLAPLVDAMNIDIKSMEPGFYRKICKSELEPVLSTCRAAKAAGIHLEITNLVIPTLNDSDELISKLVDFVEELGPEVPLHFSSYFPSHKMRIGPTPLSSLLRTGDIARKKLYYVYLGNVSVHEGCDTQCPGCGNTLVKRCGAAASVTGIGEGRCLNCGRTADFIL
ncbi:MAG: AmmeMemoRadiSam system radical SAM enzyme [Actinobacteria bacterium]|nr:AmmeMemoRadiSam system radical SAM enzyme [Actinomycetota bacterium]